MIQKLYNIIKKDTLFFTGLFFSVFFCFTLVLLFFYPFTNTNLWHGYYVILLKQKKGSAFNPQLCKKILHLTSLITEDSETVLFSDFEEMEEIRITKINERLDLLDPRLDPYMLNKINYFNPDDTTQVLYIKTPLHPFLLYIKAAFFFAGHNCDYKIPDINLVEILIHFWSGFFYMLVFIVLYRKESEIKYPGLIGFIPWIPGLLSGDVIYLIDFFIMYPAWFLFFEETFIVFKNRCIYKWNKYKTDNLKARLIFLFLMLLASVIISVIQRMPSIIFLFSFFANISLIPGYCLFFNHYNNSKGHTFFESVPISPFFRKTSLLPGKKMIPLLLCTGIVIISFSLSFLYRQTYNNTKAIFPIREVTSKEISYKNLEKIWREKSNNFVPDLSDYIVHTAFQQGFQFGKAYSYPSISEPLQISDYKRDPDTGKIIKNQSVKIEYSQKWYNRIINHIPRHSVEKMLLAQKKALHVDVQPVGYYYQYRLPEFHIIVLSLLSLILVFFLDFYLTPFHLYDSKRFALRRWFQPA